MLFRSAICAAAALLALATLTATHWSVAALVTGMFFYGGVAFSVYPLSVAFVNDRLAREHALASSSGLLLVYGVGAAIGPALAGSGMEIFGPHALFVYFALVFAPVAAFAYYRTRSSPEAADAQRGQFVAMIRTSAEAIEMTSETGREAEGGGPKARPGADVNVRGSG